MTSELEKLIDEHEKLFGYDPTSDMELEYGQDDYDILVSDIKKAIKDKKPICEIVDME